MKYIFTSMSGSITIGLSGNEIDFCNSQFNWFTGDIETCSIGNMGIDQFKFGHPTELGHRQVASNLAHHMRAL